MSSPQAALILQEDNIAYAVAAGTPDADIVEAFNITPAALAALKGQPGFAAQVERRQEQVRLHQTILHRSFQALSYDAVRTIEGALIGTDPKQKYDAAKYVIDKFIPNATAQKGDTTINAQVVAAPELVQSLVDAVAGLKEARGRGGPVVDLDADPHFHRA